MVGKRGVRRGGTEMRDRGRAARDGRPGLGIGVWGEPGMFIYAQRCEWWWAGLVWWAIWPNSALSCAMARSAR
jgi:hypothetical protein